MRPLTDHTPKPLLQVCDKPLIVWHIESLVRAGMTEIIINLAHLGNLIESALGNGSQFGTQSQYSHEAMALETAGGIANALPLLGNEPFAVVNGDIFCDFDFSSLLTVTNSLQANTDTAHLVLVNNPVQHPEGDFYLQADRIISAPSKDSLPTKLTFSGIGLYHPQLFSQISPGTKAPLAPLLRAQIDLGKVSGQPYQGRWVDVGTPQRLNDLDNELRTP